MRLFPKRDAGIGGSGCSVTLLFIFVVDVDNGKLFFGFLFEA